MLAVTTFGVSHKPHEPAVVAVNHDPPVAVEASTRKLKFAPVLATVMVWEVGFEPPNAFVNVKPLNCTNTAVPTVTLTGTVMREPPPETTGCPQNVPAISPWFGNDPAAMLTLTGDGALPLVGVTFSQLPPSEVVAVTVQFSTPQPTFVTPKFRAERIPPAVTIEKLICPGRLSK